ncbi:MAG: hypothetical protein ACK4TF_01375 [Thermodesulfovibrionales bacterium]
MPVILPLEVYEALEKGLGKEDAKRVIHGLEATISEATEYKWKVTKDELLDAIRKEFITKELFEEKINSFRVDFKDELLGAIRKEFVTKEVFEERMNALRADLEGRIENVRLEMHGIKADLEGKIENVRADLEGKIENVRADLEGKIENVRVDLKGEIRNEVLRLDRKFTVMFIILFFTIIFLNQNALEFLAKILGLIK